MRLFTQVIVILCFLWTWLFLLFGGTERGEEFITNFASHFFADQYSGAPVLVLALPVVVAGSIASIGATYTGQVRSGVTRRMNYSRKTIATCLLIVPCIIYPLSLVYLHLHGRKTSKDVKLKAFGNAFGMMAMVVMSWLLIPVSSLGPLQFLFSCEPSTWTLIHIWSGCLVIVGAILHSILHAFRWIHLREDLLTMMVPPISCWTDRDFQPTCKSQETECTCYYFFRNFAGALSTIGIVVLGLSSIYRVRRWNFTLFALFHRFSSPIIFITFFMHYNKGVLFTAGGLLYFLAATFPIWIEHFFQKPVKITSVTKLECQTHPCVSIEMEATKRAIECFRPGVFCYLKVPSLSSVSHPFTVNPVPGRNEMRLIFRVAGPFTRDLGAKLSSEGADVIAYMRGYYGSLGRVNQVLNHDTVVIVAAGIGIAPYLCLLQDLASRTGVPDADRPRAIALHWICRDAALIDYCYREYFAGLHWPDQMNLSMTLFVHKTGSEVPDCGVIGGMSQYAQDSAFGNSLGASGLESCADDSALSVSAAEREDEAVESFADEMALDHSNDSLDGIAVSTIPRAPYSPSSFTVSDRILGNWSYFLVFALTAWLGLVLVWHCYQNLQQGDEVLGRAYTAVLLGLLGLVIGGIANTCYHQFHRRKDGIAWDLVSSTEDADTELDSPTLSVELSAQESPGLSNGRGRLLGGGVDHKLAVQESTGRPAVEDLIAPLRDAASPAVFYCVPAELQTKLQNMIQKEIPNTVLYEEVFDI